MFNIRRDLFPAFVAIISIVTEASAAAPAFPASVTFHTAPALPPIVFATRVEQPPSLDGILDDAAWKSAAVVDRFITPGGGATSVRTTARVCFDKQNLYIAFDCEEPEIDRLDTKVKAGEDKFPDNCVEIFVDRKRRRDSFYQFVTNEADAHNDYGPYGKIEWNGQWKSKAGRDADGWVSEIAIPWKDFGYDESPVGSLWGFNLTRERSLKGTEKKPAVNELATWSELNSFSAAAYFGGLFLGTAKEFEAQAPAMAFKAVLDKHVYSTLDRHAVAAVALDVVKADGCALEMSLFRGTEAQPLRHGRIEKMSSPRLSMDVPLAGLDPGEYRLVVNGFGAGGRPSEKVADLKFRIEKPKQAPARSGRIVLRQSLPVKQPVSAWHVRTGVPFPEGALWDASQVSLEIGGKPTPVQTEVTALWNKGGSIKWLGLDFQLPLAGTPGEVSLVYGPDKKPLVSGALKVHQTDHTITVDTGVSRCIIRKKGFNLVDELRVGAEVVIAPSKPAEQRGLYMVDEQGVSYWSSADPDAKVIVEQQGPQMTVVRAEGAHVIPGDAGTPGKSLGRYVARFYFYAGVPYFRLQHTFIIAEDTSKTRYADIGMVLPIPGDDVTFGVPEGVEPQKVPTGGSLSLLQKRWDQFVVKANGAAASAPLREGGSAPGWFGRGGVAVVMREFWQNFPKELEATPERLIVHFWPAHGEVVYSKDEEASAEDGWRLPFVHQGKLLNFQMPEHYFTGPLLQEYGFGEFKDNRWQLRYGDGARKANAMGVAKTHDMLIVLGGAPPEKIAALREAFEAGVHFMPDPSWVCGSRVAGDISPANPERFPTQEAYYRDGFEYLMRWTLEMNHAYGMFNYGDSFTISQTSKPKHQPAYYRLWAGFHHGRARVPWLLYLRSGDPKYLHWARANTQHLEDVDTCHFTTPEFATHPDESVRKLVGGMHDYKGIVHWHTGARSGEYNSMMDFLMYDYYLTGNRRSWDVLLETGHCAVDRGTVSPERQGAGCLSLWLDFYKATWDGPALLRLVSEMPLMYTKPAVEHFPQSIGYAPYLEPWIEYSGDARAKEFLIAYCNDLISRRDEHLEGSTSSSGRPLALAYRLTGDEKYLRLGWSSLNGDPGLYENPEDDFHHFVDWLPYSFGTQQSIYLLALLDELQHEKGASGGDVKAVDSTRPVPWVGLDGMFYAASGPGALRSGGVKEFGVIVALPEKSDTAFTVGGRFSAYANVSFRWLAPDGHVLKEGVVEQPQPDSYQFIIDQPADGVTGEYRLEMTSKESFFFYYANTFSSLKTHRFVVPGPERGHTLGGNGRWFFYVPADCKEFAIKLRPVNDAKRTVAQVFNPEDRPVKKIGLPFNGPDQELVVEVPAEFRGKVWSLAGHELNIVDVRGIPRWLTSNPEAAREP